MGAHADKLFRRSKRDLQQRLWLQYNVMRLGCELSQSELRPSAAEPQIRNGRDTQKSLGPDPELARQVSAGMCDFARSRND
ncbi:hypothetical protein XH84_32235 [Bradyrhizobium nanningense]|nr:hypothetical protein XH84_32235 [Bradyrhizobium nanningense]